MKIKKQEWAQVARNFLSHSYLYQDKLRSEDLLAKVCGKNWSVTFFLLNYDFFYYEFPECLFLPALPRELPQRSAFRGSSFKITICMRKMLYPNLLIQTCVTGASRCQDVRKCQDNISGDWKYRLFQLFYLTAQLIPQSPDLHAAFHLFCQLLPFSFCTYAERVNFASFVPHLPL